MTMVMQSTTFTPRSGKTNFYALGKWVAMLTMGMVLLACNAQPKKDESKNSGDSGFPDYYKGTTAGGAMIARPNTWEMTLSSHTEGATYNTTTLYYGTLKGTASASGGVSGNVHIRWETYVGSELKYSGFGGWGVTKKPNDTFYGDWQASSIHLTDGKLNTIKIIAEDQIGNSISKSIYVFADGSAPTLILDSPLSFASPYWTQSASILVTGTATDDSSGVNSITGTNITTGIGGPVTGLLTWSENFAINHGVNTIRFVTDDLVTNVRTYTLTVGRDNVVPVIAITKPTTTGRYIVTNTDGASLSGTGSDADSGLLRIIWSNAATGGSGTGVGTKSWSIDNIPVVQGSNLITVTAVDKVGLTTSATIDYIADLSSPSVTAASFSLNAGAVSAATSPVPYTITATDLETKITHICLRYNNTIEPLSNDACWSAITVPSKNITRNSSFPIGVAPGLYYVYAWFKDESGRISSLTNSGKGTPGRDQETIQYVPGNHPNIIGILASNTDTPSDPPTEAQRTIASGGTVYIKWRATDVEGLAAAPMTLQYTTNENTWNNIAVGINNNSGTGCVADNGGTTADNGFTGCYKWAGAAPGTYFRIRVTAKDNQNLTTTVAATPLNAGKFVTVAGNNDTGIDSSAASGVIYQNTPSPLFTDGSSMAVATNGMIYIRDLNRGILRVNPADGLLKVLVKKDSALAANNGDNGDVANATVKYPMALTLDENENVLIYDYGRIRRINMNTSPITIETIIGGGADTSDVVQGGTQVSIGLLVADQTISSSYYTSTKMPLFALPNGDIIFTDRDALYGQTPASTHRLRYYDKDTQEVRSIRPNGTGTKNNGAKSISACAIYGFALQYDSNSSDLTHLFYGCDGTDIFHANGSTYASASPHPNMPAGDLYYSATLRTFQNNSIYAFGKLMGAAKKLNSDGTWTTVLGTGIEGGNCPDGTLATACPVHLLDFYVAKDGRIYFMERGRIRMLDETNKVVTLVGQGTDYGDGNKASTIRLGNTEFLGQWLNAGTPTIDFLDYQNKKIREFPVGGNVTKMAGDGSATSPANNSVAANTGLMIHSSGNYWTSMAVNYNNGEIYQGSTANIVSKLNRGTGQWNYVVGGGATNYYDPTANGKIGTQIALANYPPNLVGYAGGTNKLLLYTHTWTGTLHYYAYYKMLDSTTNFTVSHLAGSNANDSNGSHQDLWCAVGNALSGCAVPYTHDRFVLQSYDAFSARWAVADYGSTTVYVLPPAGNLTLLKTLPRAILNYAYRHDATYNMLYYCATDNKLYQYNLGTSTETALTVNLPNFACVGRSMVYNPTRNSIIFLYRQNGVNAVGEYGL